MTSLTLAIASGSSLAEEGEFMTRCRRVARLSSAGDAAKALGLAAGEYPAPSAFGQCEPSLRVAAAAGDPVATPSLPCRPRPPALRPSPPSRLRARIAAIASAGRFRGVSLTSTPEQVRGAMAIPPKSPSPPPPEIPSLPGFGDLPGNFRRLQSWLVAVSVEGGNDEDGSESLFLKVSASASPHSIPDPPLGRLRARRGEYRTSRCRAVAVGARGGRALRDPVTRGCLHNKICLI